MATVAVLGLGAMGSRMAMRLFAAGHEVDVWNRTPGRSTKQSPGPTGISTPTIGSTP